MPNPRSTASIGGHPHAGGKVLVVTAILLFTGDDAPMPEVASPRPTVR